MSNYPRLYVGPMSKNIVDCVCLLDSAPVGMIPSRRQVGTTSGYVNNWNTKSFASYVRSKNSRVVLQRDHGGPLQGNIVDDGLESLLNDVHCGLDLIHIDPWKAYPNLDDGINDTIRLIHACHQSNPNSKYEISTEQAIREFSTSELREIFSRVQDGVGNIFENVVYGVVQGGTSIRGNKNTGVFNETKFIEMIK